MRLVLRFVSSVRDRLHRAMRNDAFLFLPRRSLLHSHPHLHFRYLQSQHSMHRAHATWYPVIPLYVVCDCCPWAATDGELLALGEIPSLAAAHGSSGLSNTGITTSMPLGAPWKRWNYAASATLHIAADNAALRPTHDCGDVEKQLAIPVLVVTIRQSVHAPATRAGGGPRFSCFCHPCNQPRLFWD